MISKEEFNETQQKLYETLTFLAKLLFAGAIFQGILWAYPNTAVIQSMLADLIAAMLNSSGVEATAQTFFVYIGDTPYYITQDCLGWKSLAAFTGLVFASTKRTLEHANFIMQGFAIIILANIVRIYSTIILAEKGVISFNVIHDFFWSWSLTLLVLGMWAFWMMKLKDREPLYQKKIKEQVKELRQK
jgi:exosortase/archaeosortase family protein